MADGFLAFVEIRPLERPERGSVLGLSGLRTAGQGSRIPAGLARAAGQPLCGLSGRMPGPILRGPHEDSKAATVSVHSTVSGSHTVGAATVSVSRSRAYRGWS